MGISVLTACAASIIGARIVWTGGGGGSPGNNQTGGIAPGQYFSPSALNFFRTALLVLLVYAFVGLIVSLILGGAGKLGYARYNLCLADHEDARFGDLFSQFDRLGDGFVMNLLLGIYTLLWSLLLIIPGIVKSYSYAMTPYILYEHPEYSPNDARIHL